MGKKLTKEEIIKRATLVHDGKYDYSELECLSVHLKDTIICPIHGKFRQSISSHLQGHGCPKCAINKQATRQSMGKDIFITKAKEVHGDRYDYSRVKYVNNRTKVCIICPKHGEFWQTPEKHLLGRGCQKCANEYISNIRHDTFEDFLKKTIKVHGNKFMYHKETYMNSLKKTLITCPIHGDFWQVPSSHLRGVGCPICRESKLEREISIFLDKNNIDYIRQCGSDNFKWLGKQTLDFFIPKYNVAIECQGEQHFKRKKNWDKNGRNSLEHRIELDKRKLKLCKDNGIKMLYYSDKQYEDNIIIDKSKMLEEIKKI